MNDFSFLFPSLTMGDNRGSSFFTPAGGLFSSFTSNNNGMTSTNSFSIGNLFPSVSSTSNVGIGGSFLSGLNNSALSGGLLSGLTHISNSSGLGSILNSITDSRKPNQGLLLSLPGISSGGGGFLSSLLGEDLIGQLTNTPKRTSSPLLTLFPGLAGEADKSATLPVLGGLLGSADNKAVTGVGSFGPIGQIVSGMRQADLALEALIPGLLDPGKKEEVADKTGGLSGILYQGTAGTGGLLDGMGINKLVGDIASGDLSPEKGGKFGKKEETETEKGAEDKVEEVSKDPFETSTGNGPKGSYINVNGDEVEYDIFKATFGYDKGAIPGVDYAGNLRNNMGAYNPNSQMGLPSHPMDMEQISARNFGNYTRSTFPSPAAPAAANRPNDETQEAQKFKYVKKGVYINDVGKEVQIYDKVAV